MITNTIQVKEVVVIELRGEIDANTAPQIQAQVLSLTQNSQKIMLDLSSVSYMSSAGLRILLSLYRQTTAKHGNLILVGLCEELEDTMSITGFLNFFTVCKTRDSGLAAFTESTTNYQK